VGLWEHWELENLKIDSCIIVTQANALLAPIHDRMPVIVDRSNYERWLDPNQGQDDLLALLKPMPDTALEATRSASRSTSPRTTGRN
jgi:putative SOS response-associated peptidase YedK